jgi:zinc/manganese transport system ATP-binding protein
MSGPILTLKDVTLGYDRHPAVHHLTLQITRGSLSAVVGPNGAGKSTLLKGLSGALEPLSGTILTKGAARMAWLPQTAALDRSFPISVFDLVAMGLWHRLGPFGRLSPTDRTQVHDALSAVGLSGFERRTIDALSGGQLQRALFARLMLQDADLILLDEPLAAVDTKTSADLIDLIRTWHAQGRTIIAVLHDMQIVRNIFPQTLLLARECVAHGPTEDVLSEHNLARARDMIEAFDEAAHVCAQELVS